MVLSDLVVVESVVFCIFGDDFLPWACLFLFFILSVTKVHLLFPKHLVPFFLISLIVVFLRSIWFDCFLEWDLFVFFQRNLVFGSQIRDFIGLCLPLAIPLLMEFRPFAGPCLFFLNQLFSLRISLFSHKELEILILSRILLRIFHHWLLQVLQTTMYPILSRLIRLVYQTLVVIRLLDSHGLVVVAAHRFLLLDYRFDHQVLYVAQLVLCGGCWLLFLSLNWRWVG